MHIPRNVILPLVAALISSAATYLFVNSSNEKKLEELKAQLSELEKKEREAIVTQRISEQMEDIAFQQKALSDVQRERAIEQSRIADMERGKAEIERGLAIKAQKEAQKSEEEAKHQADIAEAQTMLATNNMIAAEEARAHADTLFYLARANSLAQTSLSISEKGTTELSQLLSYAAWHFTNEYSGDIYQQAIFSSLLRSSESSRTYDLGLKGSVRKVVLGTGPKRTYVYGVTDYGEMVQFGSKGYEVIKMKQNFRDLVAIDTTKVIALGAEGKLIYTDFASPAQQAKNEETKTYEQKEGQLPDGLWTRLRLTFDKTMLVAMSSRMVAWIDAREMKVIAQKHFQEELTEIGFQGNRLHIFANNGKHYFSDKAGEVNDAHMTALKEKVTSYHYDGKHQHHVLGMRDGNIIIIDNNGSIKKELTGHNGSITHVTTFEDLLISTSYDHTLKFWNIRDLSTIIMPFEQTYDKWPLTFDVNQQSSMIWIGTEQGGLSNFYISAKKNATTTKKKLKRNFTPEEWKYYIGETVPYMNLKE